MTTANGERVATAVLEEDGGATHVSWVVGGAKYGRGDFENRRYLTDGGNVLVCESAFHPRDGGRDGTPGVTRLTPLPYLCIIGHVGAGLMIGRCGGGQLQGW